MKKVKYLKYLSLIMGLTFIILFCCPVYAREQSYENKSVIFLLDTSGSMKTNDPDRLAIDSIAQLVYSLPTDYKVGLVAYSSEKTAELDLVESGRRSEIMKIAESVEYNGYSNAGMGLQCAVDFLEKDTAKEKYIILLSDGEILMDNDAITGESLQQYKNAVERAEDNGIIIHVVGLGQEMEDMDNDIFVAANQTGGKSYHTSKALNLQEAIDTILNDEFEVKQTTVAIVDANGSAETVSAEIPFAYADKIRVLLTSNAPIQNLNTNFQADSARQINGARYSLIEIEKPTDSRLELSFIGTQGSQVRVNVIPEYQVTPAAEIEYQDEFPTEQNALHFNRTARITYRFFNADNEDIQLWNTEYFNHNKISIIRGNGEIQEMTLNDGKLEMEQEVKGDYGYEVQFDYSKLPVNVIGTDTVSVKLDGAPLLPVEEPKKSLVPFVVIAAIVIGMFLIVILMLVIINMRKPKPIPQLPEDRPEPGKYGYIGKLNIYITRTQSGYDIPPLSYNLFRLPSGKVISMQEVLEDCNVDENFQGAEAIYFKAGANRSLILTNNSDCTIMKNREILMKKKSYQLLLEAKVDITFEDEISELTFQYKDLRPSEKW